MIRVPGGLGGGVVGASVGMDCARSRRYNSAIADIHRANLQGNSLLELHGGISMFSGGV